MILLVVDKATPIHGKPDTYIEFVGGHVMNAAYGTKIVAMADPPESILSS